MGNTKTEAVATLALESSLTAAVAAAQLLAGEDRLVGELLRIKTDVVARRRDREADYTGWLSRLHAEGPNQPGDATA